MTDDDGTGSTPELERLGRLLRERAGTTLEAALAHALVAEDAFPEGARGGRLMARARAAAGVESASLGTLVVRAIGEVIEILVGDSWHPQAEAPVSLRGDASGGVLVRQRLGERVIATHVAAREGDRFVLMLDFGLDAAARGTRVALFRDEREVASDALRQGRVLLPELDAGRWQVQVRDSDGWVGTLDLVLMTRAA